MNSTPFFSIVIPTYNRAAMLPKALDSVMSQSFQNWELIIVDDGSTDDTKEVVRGYLDERIQYVYQNNAERSAARNNGIERASGKYICFLDSDDFYLPQHLELFYCKIIAQKEPIVWLISRIRYKEIDGREHDQEELRGIDPVELIFEHIIYTQQSCFHRDILKQERFNEKYNIAEDLELWTRIINSFSVVCINEVTVVCVNHNDRSVNRIANNVAKKELRTLNYIKQNAKNFNYKVPVSFKKRISNSYYWMAKYHYYQGARIRGVVNLFKAIFKDMRSPQTKYRFFLIYRFLINKGVSY